MEVYVPGNTSACKGLSSSIESSTDPSNSTNYSSGDLCMNDLKICLTEFLSSEDIEISTKGFNLSPGDNNKCNVLRGDECEDSDKKKSSNSASEKCFSNCVTLPALGEPISLVGGLLSGEKGQEDSKTSELNGCANGVDQCHSQSLPLPTPLKLVSAMKGSREKQGKSPKKLSVTWAPDVYDPIPTAVSHAPSGKNQRYRSSDNKKYGKNKQKGGGKSSRGSKGKGKKQARKNGSGTTKFKPVHDDSVAVGVCEPQVGIMDYNIVSSDPFCGSSFLKKSVANMHSPVMEATS